MQARIGILAAIAIPQYNNYVARTQVAEGLNLASGIKTAITEYFTSQGGFPPGSDVATNHAALGIPAQVFFHTEANGAHSAIASKTFWLIPTDNGGSLSWRCQCAFSDTAVCNDGGTPNPTTRQINEKYLPSSCLE